MPLEPLEIVFMWNKDISHPPVIYELPGV